jgi:RNA polymerase sigma-70 factor (ECF subfamily)
MDFSRFSDEELAQKLQKAAVILPNDQQNIEAVYAEIYKRYYSHAFCLARYYGLSHNDAEDVVQDVFIKLFKSIHTFKPEKPFKPWFFAIILNHTRSKHNDNKRRRYKELNEAEESLCQPEKNIFEKLQFQVYLNDITNELPEKLRGVLLLKIYGEMEVGHIAKAAGISPRQVFNRLNQAYEWLKERLEGNV